MPVNLTLVDADKIRLVGTIKRLKTEVDLDEPKIYFQIGNVKYYQEIEYNGTWPKSKHAQDMRDTIRFHGKIDLKNKLKGSVF